MTDPERLLASKGLKAELLASAKTDRAPDGSRRRALAVAAVAAAATTHSATATAGLSALARVAVWKWIAVGAVGLGTVVAARAVWVPPATEAPRESVTPRVTARGAPLSGQPAKDPPPTATAVPLPLVQQPRVASAPGPVMPVATAAPTSKPEPPAPKVPSSSTLPAEIAAIDQAKQVLASGDTADALRQIDAYRVAFPAGTLSAEATALRIEALARAGRRDEARAELARLRASHPDSPLLENLTQIVKE